MNKKVAKKLIGSLSKKYLEKKMALENDSVMKLRMARRGGNIPIHLEMREDVPLVIKAARLHKSAGA